MSMNINVNNTRFGIAGNSFNVKDAGENRKAFFAGNSNLNNDPIAQKRREAQKKALKVVGDAWDIDKEIDKSIQQRRDHYQEMFALKNEAQSQINDINNQIDALKEEYGITEDMEYKDWPSDFKQAYAAFKTPMDELNKQIHDADTAMKDDVADIRTIIIERLKSNPMLDAQKTADAIHAAADEEIIGMVMQEAKENIEEKMEEAQEKAQEKAEEYAEKKEAEEENDAPDIPLEDLMKLAQVNSETDKAQNTLKDIKNSMSLLEADLTGIEVDTEA